jgi:hypothetical protein
MEKKYHRKYRKVAMSVFAISMLALSLVSIVVLPTMAGDVYKGDLIVESRTDVQYGTSASVNVTLGDYSGNLSAFTLKLKFNHSVASYDSWVKTMDDGDVSTYSLIPGVGVLTVQFIDVTPSNWTNPTLFRVKFKANASDGYSTFINVSTADLKEKPDPGTINTIHPIITNGTFTTLDEVPPTITFDVSEIATIAGPKISVNATLYDLSGINESGIIVKLNDTTVDAANYTIDKINAMTWNVTIQPDITNYGFSLDPPTNSTGVKINVSASDNSTMQNFNYSTVNVTVAKTGFFEFQPTGYINTTATTISAKFVNIINTTVKMYLNGTNVTSSCVVGEDNITYSATNLPDDEHTVLVNGTVKEGTGEQNATWNFTVDTTPPEILYFGVSDSDGDGFNECGESLSISWNVSDANFDYIVVNDSTHSDTNYSSNSSINNWNSIYGNQEVTFKVVDKAGNPNETTFHVYNNYIAYVTTSKSLSFGGIDLNKTAVMDLMNLDVSKIEFSGGREINAPTISSTKRTFITGGTLPLDTTVVVDNNASATITNTYNSLTVYNSSTNLNFTITAPSVNRANVVLVQANSSRIDEFLEGKALNLTTLMDLVTDIKDNKTEYVGDVYFFGPDGYAKIKIEADGTFEHKDTGGTFTVHTDNITKTLKVNEVNLSQGFSAPYLASNSITLSSGEYELIALSLDEERIGLVATMPLLVVVNSTEGGTVSPTTVQKGQSLSVSFPVAEHTAAVLVKDVTYGIDMELNVSADDLYIGRLDFTATGASQTSVSPSYTRGGKTYNLSASFPTGYAAVGVSSGNSVSVNTSNLVSGDYILYAVSEKDKKVEAIGKHDVKIVELKTITVSPSTKTLYVSGTQQFTATAKDQDGNPMAGINITWTSSNPAVGTVSPASATTDSDGRATTTFTAKAAGSTMIAATNGTVSGTANVTVSTRGVVVGRGGAYRPPVKINVPVDATGKVTSTATLTTEGATLTIPAGIIVKDAEGNPLSTSIAMLHTPATAERVGAITAYNFGPSGTTFSPPIDLVIEYDPADIPAGFSESDLVVRMYDSTAKAWIDLPTTVDTVTHTATAKVSHFSIFALFAAPPVAPPPVTPTPTVAPTVPPVTPTPPVVVVPPKIPWGLIIGIIVAVIIVGSAAYYFYTKKKA